MYRMAEREGLQLNIQNGDADPASGRREKFPEPAAKRRRRLQEVVINRTVNNLTDGMREALDGMVDKLARVTSQPGGSPSTVPPDWVQRIDERQTNLETRLNEIARQNDERQQSVDARLARMETSLGSW